MENPNPTIHQTAPRLQRPGAGEVLHALDPDLVFEIVRDINDPEYPNTLEQLAVVVRDQIAVDDAQCLVHIDFTPTIPHCSMATLIGLCIRIKLMRTIPPRYDIDVYIKDGAHVAEEAINKQLNDKERVAAAMENPHLLAVVEQCLSGESKTGIAFTIN